jgi:hypothetical protein
MGKSERKGEAPLGFGTHKGGSGGEWMSEVSIVLTGKRDSSSWFYEGK